MKAARYNDARDSFLKSVELDSTYTPALRDLAHLFRRADQHDRAAKIYVRYLEQQPDDVDAWVGFSESCLELGLRSKAIETAKTAFAKDSTRVDARLALARAEVVGGDPGQRAEAFRLFSAVTDTSLLTAKDEASMGGYLVETKDFPAARTHLNRAIAKDAGEPAAYYHLGIIALTENQPDSAAVQLQKAVALDPNSPLYRLNLGVAYVQAKRPDRVTPQFRLALQLNDKLIPARLLLAQALATRDSLLDAEREYRKVLEQDKNNVQALNGLGFCLMKMVRYSEAADTYLRITVIDPKNANAWVGVAGAYSKLGRKAEAAQAMEKAAALDPKNKSVIQWRQQNQAPPPTNPR